MKEGEDQLEGGAVRRRRRGEMGRQRRGGNWDGRRGERGKRERGGVERRMGKGEGNMEHKNV